MISITLPGEPAGQLLWAQAAFAWLVAQYAVPRGPYGMAEARAAAESGVVRWKRLVWGRSCVAALWIALLPGLDLLQLHARLVLGTTAAVSLVVLPFLRRSAALRPSGGRVVPVIEVVGTGGTLLALGAIVAAFRMEVGAALFELPGSSALWIDGFVVASAAVLLTGSATHMVRALLDAVSAGPSEGRGADGFTEYNRGRVIGNLERILVLLLALAGEFAALALVIAAKGLVRWKELEDEEFAEYFLVGTLTSLLVAIGVAFAATAITG